MGQKDHVRQTPLPHWRATAIAFALSLGLTASYALLTRPAAPTQAAAHFGQVVGF